LPWRAVDLGLNIEAADRHVIATCNFSRGPAEGNVAFIVRAVNSHDDLLAALKALRNEVIGAIGIGVADSIGHTNTRCLGDKCQDAYAAIQKAEHS
jgi:hypothetical protein